MWSRETLAYYLKGCRKVNLWTNHSPLSLVINKDIQGLIFRMQKFWEAIGAYNIKITHIQGIRNQICNALSRAPAGGYEGVERVLNSLKGHASNAYNRILSSAQRDITAEGLEDWPWALGGGGER